ncbi:DNA-packaging protein [Amaricoccus solimangrovi]|uniref:Terminase small subunit n=1 Tax=Amaricoccus solimangrovi TaxID=2589815 RepID=A0A501WX91_9RHOB|nr:DNA-packaging protein [Amaricoccus solimangrovi]TPE53070.1 terminase small subunit [Amaricoccus solimangrovi]
MSDWRDDAGRFLPGNRFWEARSSCGPNPKFSGPDELWRACCEYFSWNAENPLYEAKAFAYEGAVTVEDLPKMRAMTLAGLCMFLDIGEQTWRDWRSTRPDLSGVITRAEAVIRRQKFEGASAGLLVPSIIARDLGLADRQEISGPDKGPVQVSADAAELRGILTGMASNLPKEGEA